MSRQVRPTLVLITCCLSLLIVMMDVTIVNVALPAIHHTFGGSLSTLQWVADAYTLVVAAGLMLGGAFADRFGRKRIFMIGLLLFSIGSALCGLAAGPVLLVAARAVQGMGGAMLNPVALSIISNVFTDPAERAKALGFWGMMSGVALGIGPLVGGVIVAFIGWRVVFWVNIPIGAAALLLCARFVPESRAPQPRPIDVPGQFLASILLFCLIAALIEAPHLGWSSPVSLALFAGTLLAFAGFVAVERRVQHPMIDFNLFRAPAFTAAMLIAVCVFTIFGAFLFLNTLYLQDVRGFTALRAGVATVPAAIGIVCGSQLSGRMLARIGPRAPLLCAAIALLGGSLLLIDVHPATPLIVVLLAYLVCGFGHGFANAPISSAAMNGMPRERAGVAASLASTGRQVGASLGIALGGAFIAGAVGAQQQSSASHAMWWVSSCLALCIGALALSAFRR